MYKVANVYICGAIASHLEFHLINRGPIFEKSYDKLTKNL